MGVYIYILNRCRIVMSLEKHLDHYPHPLTGKEVSSISSRYPLTYPFSSLTPRHGYHLYP